MVSTQLNLADLTPNTSLDLNTIAFAGQNVGGAPIGATSESGTPTPHQYIVLPGETLSQIATQNNLHIGSILIANSDIDPKAILYAGQVLIMPEQDASPSELQAEATKLATLHKPVGKSTKKSQQLTSVSVETNGSFIHPIPEYRYMSQGFSGAHTGVDLVAPIGTPVRATKDACIIHEATGWNGGYGNVIIIDIGNRMSALYGHLSAFGEYQEGDCMSAGTVIGFSGSTGHSSGPHLHFEIRTDGQPQDPLHYIEVNHVR